MITPYSIRPGEMYRGVKPVKDESYKRFIRRWPCIGCGTWRGIEAMHTGPRGLGQKSSDTSCLPGCRRCHEELHKVGPVRFQEIHQINFDALRAYFQQQYALKYPAPKDEVAA